MGLKRIREFLTLRGIGHQYIAEDGCASIDFLYKGLSYHIWEFPAEEQGAESNVRSCGRMEVFSGDYEEQILAVLKTW